MQLLRQKLPTLPGYDIQEKIGEGGIGTVYKAVQHDTNRLVAIKLIQTNASPKAFLRAEREFRSASRLVHPNIVQALDFIRDVSAVFVVMEYVEGQSLGEFVEKNGRMSEEAAVAVITQISQALHFIHRRGMVHRDVKPDNILLTPNGKAKLTDFGLVKDLGSNNDLTDAATALGTPQFMAPEQYTSARKADARCDVYSLGATLYVAVTGRLPFGPARSLAALMKRVNRGAIVPPQQLVPDLSEDVENAIRLAMCPYPSGRPRSCPDFIKEIKGKGKRYARLGRVGNQKAKEKTAETERRAAVRYPLNVGTDCTVETSLHTCAADPDDHWSATVQDLSRNGLALVLARRLEKGTVVVVDVEGVDGDVVKSLHARVVRLQPQGFGQWLVGCQLLEPLSPEDVRILL
jgi:serine/threonine protein kinase